MPKKLRKHKYAAASLMAMLASLPVAAKAAEIVYDGTTLGSLDADSSWIGGVQPGASDVAVFDEETLSSGGTITPAGAVSIGGIRIFDSNPSTAASGVLEIYNVNGDITVGASGIDMATSSLDLKIDGNVSLVAGQDWNLAAGRNITLDGSLAAGKGGAVNFNLASGAYIQAYYVGSKGLPLGPWATFNGSDFATLDGDLNIAGLYAYDYANNPTAIVANPVVAGTSEDTNGNNILDEGEDRNGNGVLDLTTDSTTDPTVYPTWTIPNSLIDITTPNLHPEATAMNLSGSNWNQDAVHAFFRFNTPHPSASDWIIRCRGSAAFYPASGGGAAFLIGKDLGGQNVIFDGTGNVNAIRVNNKPDCNVTLNVQNTQGDFIFKGGISLKSSGTGYMIKTGPGRAVFANELTNSFTGMNNLEGTLQLGDGTTTGNYSGPIVNQGHLVLNRSDEYAFPSAISGRGDLSAELHGSGKLILTGNNSYTGNTSVSDGILELGSATAVSSSVGFSLKNATLSYQSGITTDPTTGGLSLTGTNAIDVGDNNVMGSSSIIGEGSLTKLGVGSLTLEGGSSYTGGTTVSAGSLVLANTAGSATGSGSITLASGATLAGDGMVTGAVATATDSVISPGLSDVGSMTVGSLNLASGSILKVEAGSGANDQVVVTDTDGLTINGGGLYLYTPGTSNPMTTFGDYTIMTFAGSVQGAGVDALSVLNPQAGLTYSFSVSGNSVVLTVGSSGALSQWTQDSGGSWGTSGNWSSGVPDDGLATAHFTTELSAPATITLDGVRTFGGLLFNSTANGYTIAPGSGGSIILDNASNPAAIGVGVGTHEIAADTALSSDLVVTVVKDASLTMSAVISGDKSVTKANEGTLVLSADNTYTQGTIVNGGTVEITSSKSLGTGDLDLNGGGVRLASGNTDDISDHAITIGTNGGTIDTNGNDATLANSIGNGGIGAFTKAGDGALTVGAASTYQGATNITGGSLVISANDNLGDETVGSALHLDGGALATTADIALDNGTNIRSVTVSENGGGFDVAENTTLTVNGVITGTGVLTKTGAGNLTLTAKNDGFSGGVDIEGGSVSLVSDAANTQTGIGTGPITLGDQTSLSMNGAGRNSVDYGVLANAITVPENATATLYGAPRGSISGSLSGAGTLNLYVDYQRLGILGQWSTFTGILNVLKTSTGEGDTDIDDYYMTGAQALGNAKVHIGAGVRLVQSYNPSSDATGTVHNFGELTADAGAILSGNPVDGRINQYSMGSLNTDFTIDGQFRGLANIYGFGFPVITKVGTGTLTLNGSHMLRSPVNVNAGTLKLMGSIERFYRLWGADSGFGRIDFRSSEGGVWNSDDTIQLTQPEGTYSDPAAPLAHVDVTDVNNIVPDGQSYWSYETPQAMTVATGATLAGNGRFGGQATINAGANLRPDAEGTIGGQLVFSNDATLVLTADVDDGSGNITAGATSTFDINGLRYTGVKVEGTHEVDDGNGGTITTSNLTYGGALVVNFLAEKYNGAYALFEHNGDTSASSFNSVTVDSVALTNTSGVWTGANGAINYSFSEATGSLTVTGATDAPVAAVAPTGLQAMADNAIVSLTWSASDNAASYKVKRGLNAGGPYLDLASGVTTLNFTDTSVLNGTTYYYVVSAENSVGAESADSNEVSATPMAPVLPGIDTWRNDYFGTTDNAGDAANTADPDGDGIPNLIEYATGTNPTVANSSAATIGVDNGFLTLTFNRIADDTITYSVEAVDTLTGTWSSIWTSGTEDPNVAETKTVTDTVAISAGSRRFLRLSVTVADPTP